jgi:uncharacterized protein (DUF302 family)
VSAWTLTVDVERGFIETEELVRSALAEQGFGVLTEIDLAETLRTKLGVEVPRQKILGACRPELAHQALEADPSVAALLPCNVVLRALDAMTTRVETFDPATMSTLGGPALAAVAGEATTRLRAVLASVSA